MNPLQGQHSPIAYTSSLPLLIYSEDAEQYFKHWHMWKPTVVNWLQVQWSVRIYTEYKGSNGYE